MPRPGPSPVVLDGAPEPNTAGHALLARANVVRLDNAEAALLAGEPVCDLDVAQEVARSLRRCSAHLVCIALADGDLAVWRGGSEFLAHPMRAVDPTGGGESFVAGMVAALRSGADHARARARRVERGGGDGGARGGPSESRAARNKRLEVRPARRSHL